MIKILGRILRAMSAAACIYATPLLAGNSLSLPYVWETTHSIPHPAGRAILASAVSNGAIVALVSDTADRRTILFLELEGEREWRSPQSPIFPGAFSCATGPASENALVCFGGEPGKEPGRQVIRIEYDKESRDLRFETLPDLPDARAGAGAVVYRNQLFVAGGSSPAKPASPSQDIWMLDLERSDGSRAWESLPPMPAPGALDPTLVVQDHGDGYAIYLFEGSRLLEYNILKRNWRLRESPPVSPVGSAVAVGTAHILALPEPLPPPATADGLTAAAPAKGPLEFLAFHTITGTWAPTVPADVQGRPFAVRKDGDAIVVLSARESGEIHLIRGALPEVSSHFRILDYGVLFVYFAALIYMGHWFSKREKSTNDYFRGGKRVPGWAAGISIIGTKFSAVSFMSIPAKTFATNWNYFAMQIGILVAAVVVIRYFIPFFCNLDVTTAYEYLERRFNLLIRLIGSIKFVLFEVFRMGILVLLPSIVLTVITGIDIYLCILIIGVVSTIYTILGGIEAVIWTDVIQVFIMVGGTIFGIGYAFVHVDAGVVAAMGHAAEAGKTQVFDFEFTLATATVWVLLLSLPGAANNYVANQTIVQRFISTKDTKQAARSMWVTAIVGPSILFLFYLMGTALYLFYQSNPDRLNIGMQQPDEVLAWYIVRELPVGISGLLVGAIFAATMSSLDSALSSTSTVFVSDIYRRFKSSVPDHKALRLAKILTAALGILGTCSALLLVAIEIKSLFDEFMKLMGLLGGGLAGIFILGTMTRRTHSAGVLVGFIVSVFVLWYTTVFTDVHFFLYSAVGMGACVVVGYLASVLMPVRQKSLEGLTIHTTER